MFLISTDLFDIGQLGALSSINGSDYHCQTVPVVANAWYKSGVISANVSAKSTGNGWRPVKSNWLTAHTRSLQFESALIDQP